MALWRCFIFASAFSNRSRAGNLNTETIRQITGIEGTYNQAEGVYKVSVPRTDVKVTVDGTAMPPFMGLIENELQPVLRALRKANINVVAIHNHMEGEEPKSIFLHYWGRGPAEELANGVKTALGNLHPNAGSPH